MKKISLKKVNLKINNYTKKQCTISLGANTYINVIPKRKIKAYNINTCNN